MIQNAKHVLPQELASVDDPQRYYLVDVRTPGEFGEVNLPGSHNFPLGDLGRMAPTLRDACEGREIVLVCRTGRRAEKARVTLEKEGLQGARILEGGVVACERAGLALERGQKAVSIERQVRILSGILVLLGAALGFFVHPGFYGLCAFIGAGLIFAGATDTCGMGMLLAKLPWNRASATCHTG